MFLRTKILGSTRQEKYERDFEEGLVFFSGGIRGSLDYRKVYGETRGKVKKCRMTRNKMEKT